MQEATMKNKHENNMKVSGMGVLLYIYFIFLEYLFLRTHVKGCFSTVIAFCFQVTAEKQSNSAK